MQKLYETLFVEIWFIFLFIHKPESAGIACTVLLFQVQIRTRAAAMCLYIVK